MCACKYTLIIIKYIFTCACIYIYDMCMVICILCIIDAGIRIYRGQTDGMGEESDTVLSWDQFPHVGMSKVCSLICYFFTLHYPLRQITR